MHFCTVCEIILLVGVVLENLMWSLKSPWKMVAFFCVNPVQSLINSTEGKCKNQQKRYYQWLVAPHEFFICP